MYCNSGYFCRLPRIFKKIKKNFFHYGHPRTQEKKKTISEWKFLGSWVGLFKLLGILDGAGLGAEEFWLVGHTCSILHFASPALVCITALVYLISVLVFEHFGKTEQKKRSFEKKMDDNIVKAVFTKCWSKKPPMLFKLISITIQNNM